MAAKKKTEKQTVDLVRRTIRNLLPHGRVTLARTSDLMGVSERTLQRRLAELGLTFSRMVDDVRLAQAHKLIRQQKKLTEIAKELGYADPGSFTRAFERWMGITPKQYQKRSNAESQNDL